MKPIRAVPEDDDIRSFDEGPASGLSGTNHLELSLQAEKEAVKLGRFAEQQAVAKENAFKQWYAGFAEANKVDPNPDDPRHFYDYRGYFDALQAGEVAPPEANPVDKKYHLSDEFKKPGHPTYYTRLDPSVWTLEQTKDYIKLNPPKTPDDEARQQTLLEKKTAQLDGIKASLKSPYDRYLFEKNQKDLNSGKVYAHEELMRDPKKMTAFEAFAVPYTKELQGFFTRPFGKEPLENIPQEDIKLAEKDHPVASAAGKAFGSIIPLAGAVALAPETLLGQIFAFATTGAVGQIGKEKTEGSLMDTEGRNARVLTQTVKSAAYAPLWYYTKAISLGGPVVSAVTRAGARGTGAAGIEKASGVTTQEAVMTGLATAALSGLFELTPLAVNKINTTIKDKSLDSIAETLVKNDDALANKLRENYRIKFGTEPSEKELTDIVRAGVTIDTVKNNRSVLDIANAAQRLRDRFKPVTPEVLSPEAGQAIIPFSTGDIVRFGNGVGKISKIVGDNALVVSTLGRELTLPLSQIEKTGLLPQEVADKYLKDVPDNKKEYVQQLYKAENPEVVSELIRNDPEYQADLELNKKMGSKAYVRSENEAEWPAYYKEYLDKQIHKDIPAPVGQPELIVWAGLPGSGKSQLSKELKLNDTHVQVDPDDAKFIIPETKENPALADHVQAESAYMADKLLFKKAMRAGKNIIWPKIGKNPQTLKDIASMAKANGYKVKLYFNDLSVVESKKRAYKRYLENKRLVSDEYIDSIGDNLTLRKVYDTVKEDFDEYAAWDVNVKLGEKPKQFDKGDTYGIRSETESAAPISAGAGTTEGIERPGGTSGLLRDTVVARAAEREAKPAAEILSSYIAGHEKHSIEGLNEWVHVNFPGREDEMAKLGKKAGLKPSGNLKNTGEAEQKHGYNVEKFVKDSLADRAKEVASLSKRAAAARSEGKEEIAQIYEGQAKDYMSIDANDFRKHVQENPRYYIDSNIDPFLKFKNREVNLAKPSSQKESVKKAVSGQPKTIKEVSEETKILEPNVRRILGVGTKDGTFERVEKGVYVLKNNGRDLAYIHAGDSVEILPKLAAKGFKADMVFLDIPYKTPAVIGGNRGIKYDYITPAQFQTIVKAVKKIARTDDSPVIYMYSQARSGEKAMAQYTAALIAGGFKPVARGEYTKLQKDGITQVRNMRGNVIEPEGIIVLSQSGKVDFKENPDLNFKLIRPKGYQTEKPAEMLEKMIKMTTEEGDVVLDPFAGSGVTVAESVRAGRVGVGIEKSEKAIEEFIKPRLESVLPDELKPPLRPEPRDISEDAERPPSGWEYDLGAIPGEPLWIHPSGSYITEVIVDGRGSLYRAVNQDREDIGDFEYLDQAVKAVEHVAGVPPQAVKPVKQDLWDEEMTPEQVAATVTNTYGELTEAEQAAYELEIDDFRKTAAGNLFKAIQDLGGIKPFKNIKGQKKYLKEEMAAIPAFLKNRNSKSTLDELVGELASVGWVFEDGEALRQEIIRQAANPVSKVNRAELQKVIREAEKNKKYQKELVQALEGKRRKFIQTVKSADKTAPEVAQKIESRYDPISNKETLKQAQEFVASDYSEAVEMVMGNTRASAFHNAVAIVLIDKAQAEGRFTDAISLVERTAEKQTELGQAIQALSMYQRLTPEGILQTAHRAVRKAREGIKQKERLTNFEKITKGLADPEKSKIAEKLGIPHISEIVADELRRMAEQVQNMPPGRDKDIQTALMLKRIGDLIPKNLWDKVSMVQTIAQLLNPKTFVRNFLGNVGFQITENISDLLATALDVATSLRTGKRTVYLPSPSAQVKGFKQGLEEGIEESLLGVNLKTGEASKFTLPRNGVFDKGVMGALEKTLRISLGATDRAFYQSAFNQSIRDQMLFAKSKGQDLEEPTEEMIERAHLLGLYRTFQDDNMISRWFIKAKKLLNAGGKWGFGDIALKYPKTPANILARGLEYSPFGLLKAAVKIAKPLMGQGEFDQEAFVRSLSRALTGSALMIGFGAFLASLGIISGKRAKDKDVAATRESAGLKEYQINVSALKRFVMSGFDPEQAKLREDDVHYTYDWFLPNSIGVALGANMFLNPDENVTDRVINFGDKLLQASETLQEQPLVQGLKALTRRENIAEGISESIKGIPASFVPTLLNQVRQLVDNTSRNTKDPNYYKEVYNKAIMRIPGLSSTLPARQTPLGEDKQMYQFGTNNPFNVFLNPAFVSKYKPDPVSKMVLDIWETTGQTIQFPRVAQAKVKLTGIPEPIELGPEQYTEYQKYIGNKTDVLFTILSEDEEFLALDDETKAKKLQGYLTDINTAAKIEVLGYEPAKRSKDVNMIMNDIGRGYQEIKQQEKQKEIKVRSATEKVRSVKETDLRAEDDEDIRSFDEVDGIRVLVE